MGCKKILLRGSIAVGVIIIILAGFFFRWQYVRQLELENNSIVIDTKAGPIEYASFGEGMPILVLHGTVGGYDQGLVIVSTLQTEAYQFIAVSRPGYLRTPLATGEGFIAQADAFAALLDELEIEQVAIIAVSGGGPPALQFALRHPDRLSGLVMLSANSDVEFGRSDDSKPNGSSPPPQWILPLIFSDFASWIANNFAAIFERQTATFLVGEPYTEAVLNDGVSTEMMHNFLDTIDLLSLRREGSFVDGANFSNYTGYDWASIETPALIIQGTADDPAIILQQQGLHEILPNSEYIALEDGTHFMTISHYAQIAPPVLRFFDSLATQPNTES